MAVKIGGNPKFKRLLMVSCAYDDEDHLNKFVSGFTGFYRPAPKEVENAFGGHCGIMLVVNNAVESSNMSVLSRERSREDASISSSSKKKKRHGSFDGEEFSDDEDEEDDEYDDTEEAMRALEEQLSNYQAEKQHLLTLNAEWQKKAVALMAREKALQGQTAAARASADMMAAINSSAPPTADPNNADATGAQPPQGNQTSSLEQLEKEKQYQDTLQLIVEERNRLNKQLKEFDQLALDLQTRLDDKEFKAKSISTSFKQFKK